MIINKVEPQGFCNGVKYALRLVLKAINDPEVEKPIYLLGNLIHNHFVMDDLKKQGVIIIDNNKTRLEMLDEIEEGTVVFSAHGVSPKVYEKAKNKGLNFIDATCPNVLIIHNRIKTYLEQNYSIVYIGSKKHPECEGVLDISDNINLVTSISDIDNLNIKNKNIYVTNQTTLSKYELEEIYNKLQLKYPLATIDNKICNATTLRQEAIMNITNSKLCIVVGDKNSSNSNKLVSVAKTVGLDSLLIDDYKDLLNIDLSNYDNIAITSGASTPSFVVDGVIKYLNNTYNK
jgi:4-hydroxy-3-methylbut-2-enyl diphosphate reductase